VLREAYYGSKRFGEFEAALEIGRNILTQRLNRRAGHADGDALFDAEHGSSGTTPSFGVGAVLTPSHRVGWRALFLQSVHRVTENWTRPRSLCAISLRRLNGSNGASIESR